MIRIKLLYSLLLLLLSYTGYSQFQIGAELRPKVLADNGYSVPKPADSKPYVYVAQRTRLNTLFKGEYIQTYVSVQDIRIWGDDDNFRASGISGNTTSICLHQGWFMLKPAEWLSLKIGRQLLSYDDQRIISARNWNDYQVTYDAILLKAGNSKNTIDVGISKNAESSKYSILPPQKFTMFDFVRYETTGEQLKWSAIALVTGNSVSDTVDDIRYRSTYGTNLNYSSDLFDARGSLYFQHNLNEHGGKLRAFSGSVYINREFIPAKLVIGAGLDFVSGQDETRTDVDYLAADHAFDLFYGNRHGWYGYMDYFSTMPRQGLQDYMFKAEYRITENMSALADYHYFRLAAGILDPENAGVALPRELGHELDLTLRWKLTKEASLQAGYSFFLITPTLETVKGVAGNPLRFPQFAYLMITVKPEFTFSTTNN